MTSSTAPSAATSPLPEPERPIAELLHLVHGVGAEEDGLAALAELVMRSTHLVWKCWSPTASASSMTSTSGSTLTASANASRTYMPEE